MIELSLLQSSGHTYIYIYIYHMYTYMHIHTYHANFDMVGKRMLNANNSLLLLFHNRCGNITMANTASHNSQHHYDDVIMTMLASQITSLTVVYSIVYSGVNQRKHQSSASLAFVREIHRGPVNFPHKWPVTRKMFPFDDVIMWILNCNQRS